MTRLIFWNVFYVVTFTLLRSNILVNTEHVTRNVSTEDNTCESRDRFCELCVTNFNDEIKCFWCPTTCTCHSYDNLPKGCELHWYVGQCSLKGYWLLVVGPCIGILLLVFIFLCCYCSCYANGNRTYPYARDPIVFTSWRSREREKLRNYFYDAKRSNYGSSQTGF